MKNYLSLKKIFTRISQLQYIQRILMWDEAVMMPEGAEKSRANALATLNRTTQKMLMSKKVKLLLEKVKQEDDLSPWDSVNLSHMEKIYLRAACIPLALTEQSTKTALACEQAWRKLRPQNNWKDFLSYFTQSFQCVKEIAQRQADLFHLSPYDALLDIYAPGFNQASIDSIFATLKNTLPAMVQQITRKQRNEPIRLPQGPFALSKQKTLGLTIMAALQFDFQRGRLDVSHHPFSSGGPKDVRITTRYSENDFIPSLFAICHETGHGLYEQGLPSKWIDQPVGHIDSMAMHESQSLLIEMEVCRSRPFIEYLVPQLEHQFGKQPAFTVDNLYKLVTRVKPSLIRVDADEVTYPLHIILRYEIEKGLFAGDFTLDELPAIWDECMMKYLGLSTKNNYKDGVMQDVHWPSGAFGYFPAYTLGRLIAAQLFATLLKAHPLLDKKVGEGHFQELIRWLKENVYAHAASLSVSEFLQTVTAQPLDTAYFINRIQQRYS